MRKLLALDLFCGGGGACLGMMEVGFEVVGVDIKPHKNYLGIFIQADALNPPVDLRDFDLIWASPPCQAYSLASNGRRNKRREYPKLIKPIQALLDGHPFCCIENVPGCKDLRVCGSLTGRNVGLERIDRLRLFEVSFFMFFPNPIYAPREDWERGYMCCITTSMGANSHFYPRKRAGLPGKVPNWEAKEVMGIPAWQQMTCKEIGEAVPPAYAKFIASEAFRQIKLKRVKGVYNVRNFNLATVGEPHRPRREAARNPELGTAQAPNR